MTAELVRLDIKDFDRETNTAQVMEKWSKLRVVPLTERTAQTPWSICVAVSACVRT